MAHRYFVDALPGPGPWPLPATVAHHLGVVLRVRAGELIALGDGRGGQATAVVQRVGRDGVLVDVVARETAPPPARSVHVAFAPPRMQRAEWLFEHGTELGIAGFHPLWTERTRPQGEKPERWKRIVLAAAGQCDRAWLPSIEPAVELAQFLTRPDLPVRRFLAAGGAPPIAPADADAPATLVLVGPEGGFTAAESAAIAAAGFAPRGLGPHTLRTETAALVGAALLLAR